METLYIEYYVSYKKFADMADITLDELYECEQYVDSALYDAVQEQLNKGGYAGIEVDICTNSTDGIDCYDDDGNELTNDVVIPQNVLNIITHSIEKVAQEW